MIVALWICDDSQLIQDEACEIVCALSSSCGFRGEHHFQGESITLSRRRPYAIQCDAPLSNRSQFGCERGLCGGVAVSPRKRNFEARDSGSFGARRPALRGEETGQNTDAYFANPRLVRVNSSY
jgi:hypothetical protein